MIPIITGVIASSVARGVYSFTGQADCFGSSPVTVYTSSSSLSYSSVLYQNPDLTSPYSGLFITSGMVYVVSETGNITIIATEFVSGRYSTYDGCGGETPSGNIWIPSGNTNSGAVYTACYADDSTKALNQTYNIDNSGSNLIATATITTDGSGIITGNIPCE